MYSEHLTNHINHHELVNDSTLHVIGVCSNPVRYHSRYRLARKFIEEMKQTKNAHLFIVEAAFGDRHHEITDSGVDHLRVRTNSEAWIKESLINLGIRRILGLYPDARYFAWLDADIEFRNPGWALETIHNLQHFAVVQPWQDCADLNPHGGITRHFRSFGYQHQKRAPKQKHPGQKHYEYAHSGFAWAARRDFIEAMWGAGGASGPLMDWCLLGSADHHQAFAMINETKDTIHGGMHPSFFRRCYDWQHRAIKITHGEVGFTTGRIEHAWHGRKDRRYYRERWQLFIDNHYNPDTMLLHDSQGLATLVGNHKLEQAIRLYNRHRLEDGIDEY